MEPSSAPVPTKNGIELRRRPLQARSTALVQAILDASADIVQAEGLARLTTNRVAERAGVSIGSLYQYFPNRAAILAKLAIRAEGALRARVEALLAEAVDLRGGFASLIAAAFDHYLAAAQLHAALHEAEARLGPLAREQLAGAESRISNLIAAYLNRTAPERFAANPGIVSEVKLVGHALVTEALRTGQVGQGAQARITAILVTCVET